MSLTPAKYEKAQTSPEECRIFRDAVFNVFNQKAKAVWSTKTATMVGGCFIAPASYPDYVDEAMTQPATSGSAGLYSNISSIPAEYIQIQTQIKEGSGISAAYVAEAENKYQKSQTQASDFSEFIGFILINLGTILASALGVIMALAGSIFDSAVWHVIYNTDVPLVVNIGWGIMRDISNMFFILIMIIMALAAILRLEEYDYRHLMGEVVIMAILVNFSQVIAVTIMNFVNYLAAIFYSGGLGVDIFKNMITIINPTNDYATINQTGAGGGLVLLIGKLLYLAIGTAVFVILAGMFVIRLVGLYVLIIFSPLAYVLDILPSTKNFAHEWWHKFLHYLIWAPVSLFMIRLAIVVANTKANSPGGPEGALISTPGADSSFYYFILCAFLAAAFLVAEEAGMVGSHQIVHGFEKAAHWAGHRGLHYAGRKYNEWSVHRFATPTEGKPLTNRQRAMFALVNPVASFKGWSERGEKLAHHAQALAVARGKENANILMSGATLPEAQFVERSHTNEMLKSFLPMRKEQLADIMVKFRDMKGHEGEVMRNAAFTAMLANGFTDDVLRMKVFSDEFGEVRDLLDEQGNPVLDEQGNAKKQLVTYTPEIINRFSYDYLGGPKDDQGHGHMSEQSMRILAEDAEKFAKDTHHPEIGGHAVFDTDASGGLGGFINTMQTGPGKVKNMLGKEMTELVNDPTAKFSQHSLSIGELMKDGGRGTINTATHGMQPQVAELRNVVNADGTIKVEYTEPGKMLNHSVSWGSPDASPGSEGFYGGVMQVVGSPQGMREVQHAQQRIRNGMLAAEMDAQGRLILKTRNEVRKIMRNLKHANDFARALYGQKLGLLADQRNLIPNIKYVIQGTGEEGHIKFNDEHSTDKDWKMKEIDDLKAKSK